MGYTTRYMSTPALVSRMSNDERDEAGQYAETVTLEDVLGVFGAVQGPVVTSGDVAEALGCARETARRKLRALEAQGRVDSRKTAGRVVWWAGDEHEPPEGVDPDDPFWEVEPASSGESDLSERVDEVLYGKGPE